MAYQKLCPSFLFTGYELYAGEKVLIKDQQGTIIDIVDRDDAGEDVRRIDGLLCPGFVNAHCHLELSHMKGLIERGSGMSGFISSLMIQRFSDKSKIAEAIAEAEEEMISEGIVAVGDICNTEDSIHQKQSGKLYYHNFIEALGLDPAMSSRRFAAAEALYNQFVDLGLVASMVPHAPYSVSDELFRLISAHSSGKVISMHNQESQEETDFSMSAEGAMKDLFIAMNIPETALRARHKRSLPAVIDHLSSAQKVLLVHNVVTNELDVAEAAVRGMDRYDWCLCPRANQYITGMLPDLQLLTQHSEQFVIGTDSLASNSSLSVLEELKLLVNKFNWLTTADLLKWATINGARALNIDDRFGSFRKGMRPGIVCIDAIIDGKISDASRVKLL